MDPARFRDMCPSCGTEFHRFAVKCRVCGFNGSTERSAGRGVLVDDGWAEQTPRLSDEFEAIRASTHCELMRDAGDMLLAAPVVKNRRRIELMARIVSIVNAWNRARGGNQP